MKKRGIDFEWHIKPVFSTFIVIYPWPSLSVIYNDQSRFYKNGEHSNMKMAIPIKTWSISLNWLTANLWFSIKKYQ